jgi:hypothetical protein
MREVDFHITQHHPTAMSKKIKELELIRYWFLLDFDDAVGISLHRHCTALL